jgi:hypothetical protein
MSHHQDKHTNAKEERQQHRDMALYRDHSAKASMLTFEPTDFDGVRCDANGRFDITNGERIGLSFVIDKAPTNTCSNRACPKTKPTPKPTYGYHITATVVQTLLLDRWLLSFGGQIRDVQKTPVGA